MSFFAATMMGRAARTALWCVMIAALVVLAPHALDAAEWPEDMRAVRIAPAAGDASGAPRRLISTAAEAGFNAIFVPIPLDGAARAADAASIAALIAEARQRGLRVHGVVSVTLATPAGELPASRSHPVYLHPDWLMVPREIAIEMLDVDPRGPDYLGRLARWTRANASRAGGLNLSPFVPAAVDYVAGEVARIASAHALDGMHFEGLRLPGDDFDYSRSVVDVFRSVVRPGLSPEERARLDEVARIDPFGYAAELPDEWRRFRVVRLTALMARLASTVRAARPAAVVSAGVVAGAERALTDHLQDWRTWLDNRFVDALADSATPEMALRSSYDALLHGGATAASH